MDSLPYRTSQQKAARGTENTLHLSHFQAAAISACSPKWMRCLLTHPAAKPPFAPLESVETVGRREEISKKMMFLQVLCELAAEKRKSNQIKVPGQKANRAQSCTLMWWHSAGEERNAEL